MNEKTPEQPCGDQEGAVFGETKGQISVDHFTDEGLGEAKVNLRDQVELSRRNRPEISRPTPFPAL